MKVPPVLGQRVHQAREEHRLRRRLPVPRRLRRAQLPPASPPALRAPHSVRHGQRVQVRGLRALDPGVDAVRRGRAVPRPLRRGGMPRAEKKMTEQYQETDSATSNFNYDCLH